MRPIGSFKKSMTGVKGWDKKESLPTVEYSMMVCRLSVFLNYLTWISILPLRKPSRSRVR